MLDDALRRCSPLLYVGAAGKRLRLREAAKKRAHVRMRTSYQRWPEAAIEEARIEQELAEAELAEAEIDEIAAEEARAEAGIEQEPVFFLTDFFL